MSVDELPSAEAKPVHKGTQEPFPRIWPAVGLAVVFWAFWYFSGKVGLDLGTLFFSRLIGIGVALLLATVWWWTSFRIPLRDRLVVAVVFVAGVLIASYLSHESMGGFGMYLFGIPVALSAATVALLIARRWSPAARKWAVVTALCLAFIGYDLIRMEGIRGNADTNFAFRWAQSAEDRFLAEHQAANRPSAAPIEVVNETPLEVEPGDWLEFRGPARDCVVQAGDINLDWVAHPPQLLWKKRVGPAWSSMIIVAGKLFTAEQRGETEAVVCYDATSGDELWAQAEEIRYWDAVSGAGPRATPTFAGGRIYSFGAKGMLTCLEASTGQPRWSKDALQDSKGEVQMWGFSSSPLVTDGVAIVFAGGKTGKSLLAYDAESGELRWTADAGQMSFSSPQLAVLGDKRVVLFIGELGLQGFDPADGQLLFQWGEKRPQETHSLQPHLIASPLGDRLLLPNVHGVAEAIVRNASEKWDFESGWKSKALKPDFNDFVVFQDHAFGFDGEIFACMSLSEGKRAWKKGRYGHGQVVLLEDKKLLLVLTESGEAVLLAADPAKHTELGRFQAIEGKTWNHPVVAHGRLYLRNAEEMACYDLSPPDAVASAAQ